jgi:microcystin-dependent protein
MAVSATQIQLLRSSIKGLRPDPSQLLDGQPAINVNAQEPGLFFRTNNGTLTKIGPCAVGTVPPNQTPEGSPGNSLGELWFSVQDQTLKVWTGAGWVDCDPAETGFSKVIIQPTAPDTEIYPNGALWWNDFNGEMYVLYEDPNGRQWVQVGAGGSGGGGNGVVIADQQPDPAVTPTGTLWWNDDTGSLYVLYNDGGPSKLWVQIAGAGAINAGQGGSVSVINAGTGLATLDGRPITTQGTLILKPAAANEIGGVKPGQNVTIDPDGTINVSGAGTGSVSQIQTGPGITGGPITTTGTIGLASATSNQIGGVKPGAGLGVTGDGSLFVEPATNSSIGGVIVGAGLNVSAQGVLAADPVPPGFIPSGVVEWFAGQTPPTGWLYCNGATFDNITYPALYAVIGRTYTPGSVPATQFRVPDLRGQFLRGWDNRASGGVDNGRVFGSFQNDDFKSHKHAEAGAQPGWQNLMDTINQGGSSGLTSTGNVRYVTPETTETGGTETRPKNVALLPIIKI